MGLRGMGLWGGAPSAPAPSVPRHWVGLGQAHLQGLVQLQTPKPGSQDLREPTTAAFAPVQRGPHRAESGRRIWDPAWCGRVPVGEGTGPLQKKSGTELEGSLQPQGFQRERHEYRGICVHRQGLNTRVSVCTERVWAPQRRAALVLALDLQSALGAAQRTVGA